MICSEKQSGCHRTYVPHVCMWQLAGRRGYDDTGHVAFVGLSPERVASLACAAIPDAQGTLCMPAPCTLRLLEPCVPPAALATLLRSPLAAVQRPRGFKHVASSADPNTRPTSPTVQQLTGVFVVPFVCCESFGKMLQVLYTTCCAPGRF